MRAYRFIRRVGVSNEIYRDNPVVAERLAHEFLRDLDGFEMRGPRGGRYLPVGEPFGFRDGEGGDDWMHNERSFTAEVVGRYIRPKK